MELSSFQKSVSTPHNVKVLDDVGCEVAKIKKFLKLLENGCLLKFKNVHFKFYSQLRIFPKNTYIISCDDGYVLLIVSNYDFACCIKNEYFKLHPCIKSTVEKAQVDICR